MKKTFKRLIAIVIATTTMAVGMGSMNASAITYKGTTNKTTTGGTGGTVNIRSRVYTDYYQPAGGVNVYYYGVVSDISTGSSLKTYFNITGTLTTSNSSTPISNSGTANSVKAYKAASYSGAYSYCNSKTTTSSSAYGTSSQECNRAF